MSCRFISVSFSQISRLIQLSFILVSVLIFLYSTVRPEDAGNTQVDLIFLFVFFVFGIIVGIQRHTTLYSKYDITNPETLKTSVWIDFPSCVFLILFMKLYFVSKSHFLWYFLFLYVVLFLLCLFCINK